MTGKGSENANNIVETNFQEKTELSANIETLTQQQTTLVGAVEEAFSDYSPKGDDITYESTAVYHESVKRQFDADTLNGLFCDPSDFTDGVEKVKKDFNDVVDSDEIENSEQAAAAMLQLETELDDLISKYEQGLQIAEEDRKTGMTQKIEAYEQQILDTGNEKAVVLEGLGINPYESSIFMQREKAAGIAEVISDGLRNFGKAEEDVRDSLQQTKVVFEEASTAYTNSFKE
jgi:hypothetical protein